MINCILSIKNEIYLKLTTRDCRFQFFLAMWGQIAQVNPIHCPAMWSWRMMLPMVYVMRGGA